MELESDIKNIVPSTFALSYVIKDYMYNKSNAWKSDNSIEDTFSYKNMVNWSFSEAQVLNRTYSNDNLIMKSTISSNISSKLGSTINHTLNTNMPYFIQNKLHVQSKIIYSDYNYKNINNQDLLFTLYPVNKNIKSNNNISINNKYNDIISIFNNNNIKSTLSSLYNFNYNTYINKDYEGINVILTTNNYGLGQLQKNSYGNENKWIFEVNPDVNEGYRIKNTSNNTVVENYDTTFQFIKQTGNNDGWYLIKNNSTLLCIHMLFQIILILLRLDLQKQMYLTIHSYLK